MKKRRLKFIISILYMGFILLKNFFLKLSGRNPKGKCTAVYYHSVKDKEREKFIRQMKLLKKAALPLGGSYWGKLQNGKNYVIVTFDDGFKSFLKNALPELLRLEIPCTIFFPLKHIGSRPNWQYNKRFHDEAEEIMNDREIKSLPAEYVQAGSHSYSHRIMTGLSLQDAKEELVKSKEMLEAILGKPVEQFSFPYGTYSSDLIRLALEAGYKRVFTINYEVITSELRQSLIGRVRTDPSDSLLEFKLKILGAYEWMKYLKPIKEKFSKVFPVHASLKKVNIVNTTTSSLR